MCPRNGFGSVKSVIMVDDGGFAMGALGHLLATGAASFGSLIHSGIGSLLRGGGSGAQEGQDRQDPAVVGGGGGEAELAEDAGDVLLDGPLGDDQALGDGGGAAALGPEGEDVDVAGARGGGGPPRRPTRRTAARNSATSATRSLSR